MLVVAANTDLGPSTDETGGTRVSRVNARPARTERVRAIADSFAGFAESNGVARSASLCQHTTLSLSVADLFPPLAACAQQKFAMAKAEHQKAM
jgi:hypothetical protein